MLGELIFRADLRHSYRWESQRKMSLPRIVVGHGHNDWNSFQSRFIEFAVAVNAMLCCDSFSSLQPCHGGVSILTYLSRQQHRVKEQHGHRRSGRLW